jgi:hypothetical protein
MGSAPGLAVTGRQERKLFLVFLLRRMPGRRTSRTARWPGQLTRRLAARAARACRCSSFLLPPAEPAPCCPMDACPPASELHIPNCAAVHPPATVIKGGVLRTLVLGCIAGCRAGSKWGRGCAAWGAWRSALRSWAMAAAARWCSRAPWTAAPSPSSACSARRAPHPPAPLLCHQSL